MSQLSNLLSRHTITLYLAVIVLAAFVVRVHICFLSKLPTYNTDTYEYLKMADQIIRGAPISYFPNGFPLIIVLIKSVVGPDHVNTALLLTNVLLSTAVVWMTFRIAQMTCGPIQGLIAAALVACWPNQLNYARQLMSEVPASFFLVLGLYLLLVKADKALSGVALYGAGMMRSSLLPIGPLAIIVFIFAGKRREAALLLAGFAAGFLVDYSLQKTGIIMPPANFGANLLISIGSTSAETSFSIDGFSEHQKLHPLATYVAFVAEQPLDFVKQRLSALWELWGPWPEPGDSNAPRSVGTRILIGMRLPLVVLAMFTIWNERKKEWISLLAIPLFVVTVVHVAFFASPRFTYPIEPLVVILAVEGVRHLLYHNKIVRFCEGAFVSYRGGSRAGTGERNVKKSD